MVKKQSTLHHQANNKGAVYIQAGALKGKKLEVIISAGLRPIGSRVKETFFNWIQFEIQGRDVLDLFAGSGALGFEALSRGCSSLYMCEYSKAVYDRLISNYRSFNLQSLQNAYKQAAKVEIKLTDSYAFIQKPAPKSFDLVFVDPPFMQEKELQVLCNLADNGFLRQGALVSLQVDKAYQHILQTIDSRYTLRKQKSIGNIIISLLEYQASKANADDLEDYQII